MTRSSHTILRMALVALLILLLVPAAAVSKGLQGGTKIHNYNFAKVVWTYSWSGFFAGEGEV